MYPIVVKSRLSTSSKQRKQSWNGERWKLEISLHSRSPADEVERTGHAFRWDSLRWMQCAVTDDWETQCVPNLARACFKFCECDRPFT